MLTFQSYLTLICIEIGICRYLSSIALSPSGCQWFCCKYPQPTPPLSLYDKFLNFTFSVRLFPVQWGRTRQMCNWFPWTQSLTHAFLGSRRLFVGACSNLSRGISFHHRLAVFNHISRQIEISIRKHNFGRWLDRSEEKDNVLMFKKVAPAAWATYVIPRVNSRVHEGAGARKISAPFCRLSLGPRLVKEVGASVDARISLLL